MTEMPKGLIVFDVDGTLFDTAPGILDTFEDVFRHFDIGEFDRDVGTKYIGPPVKESLMRFNNIPNEIAESATMYYRQIYVDKYIANSKPYKGIWNTLTKLLKTGYSIAIATNKTFPQVEKLLSITGIEKTWFSCIKTALETGGLDKIGMLKQICEEFNVPTTIMIGDTQGDRLAAKESGIEFIGVTYGYEFEKEIEYNFVTADSPSKIFEAIERVSGGNWK